MSLTKARVHFDVSNLPDLQVPWTNGPCPCRYPCSSCHHWKSLITWETRKETFFTMLTDSHPSLVWPVLIGENHIYAALVNHLTAPIQHLSHPGM